MTFKNIGKNIKIGKNADIKDDVIMGTNIIIGDNAFIDHGVIIRDNVEIGDNVFIGANSIIGEYNVGFMTNRKKYINPKLVVGQNALIRSHSIFYAGSIIGDYLQTGHRVTIREGTKAGNYFRVGTLSDIQGDCEIGNYVNMHSNVFIASKSIIKDFVWIFPHVVITNDPTPPSEHLCGVTVEKFAVIAAASVVLPGVIVKEGSLVGAGSIVTKDVSPDMVVVGNPAKEICNTSKIKNRLTGEAVYPWRKHFIRGMPWSNIGYDVWLENNISN